MNEKKISKLLEEQERTELYMVIIDALQKQIAKKVKMKDQVHHHGRIYITNKSHRCPTCDATVYADFRSNYCDRCGQKLDWRSL